MNFVRYMSEFLAAHFERKIFPSPSSRPPQKIYITKKLVLYVILICVLKILQVGIGRYLLKLLKSNWKKSIVLRYVSSDCLQIKPSLKCK